MKILLPLFVLTSLTVSCTRIQYLTVSSSNSNIQKNAREQFVAENDSVVVMYDFKGEGIPLGIKIINKLDKPLMVNWKKSSVVINDEAVSLSPDEVVTTGVARSGTVKLNRDMATTGTGFSAVTSLPAEKQQIPPRAFITRELMKVTGGWYKIPGTDYSRNKIELKNKSKVWVRQVNYSEEDSPLRFRTYLTLESEGGEPMVMEHAFYIAGIIRTGNYEVGGDRPYLVEVTNFTKVMGGLIVGGALVVAVAAAANAADEKDKKN